MGMNDYLENLLVLLWPRVTELEEEANASCLITSCLVGLQHPTSKPTSSECPLRLSFSL